MRDPIGRKAMDIAEGLISVARNKDRIDERGRIGVGGKAGGITRRLGAGRVMGRVLGCLVVLAMLFMTPCWQPV